VNYVGKRERDDTPSDDRKDSYASQLSNNIFDSIYGDDKNTLGGGGFDSPFNDNSGSGGLGGLGGGLGDD
jgi:hypothetical protein